VPVDGPGPSKREGDGRSPAGVFRISGIFGFAPRAPEGATMPYTRLTAACDCVDDPRSAWYNRTVDAKQVTVDWKSSEPMRRVREYEWGAFVDHNTAPVVAGAGSCIFIHIWDSADEGTAGCTAMDRGRLLEVLRWLRPEEAPVLIQMPRSAYARMRSRWGLPGSQSR
jgi:D-alanyl-D-alanine dipeptidase